LIAYLTLLLSIALVSFNSQIPALQKHLLNSGSLNSQSKIVFQNTEYKVAPELKNGASNYDAQAKSAIIFDVGSAKILYQKNSQQAVPMASLTKLMTALVIMQNHSPDETVIVPDNLPPLSSDDQKLNISPGEKFKLSELMQALLIYSANDVANALAIWDSGSINNFTGKMNSYTNQWGLEESKFTNPSGLDETGHVSSASDLLKLSTILLHNQRFRKTINTSATTIYNLANKPYRITTTNQDLTLPYVYGIKTGFTTNAGQSLILLAQQNGHEIITVILDSPDRFAESKNMVEYTFNNYIWK